MAVDFPSPINQITIPDVCSFGCGLQLDPFLRLCLARPKFGRLVSSEMKKKKEEGKRGSSFQFRWRRAIHGRSWTDRVTRAQGIDGTLLRYQDVARLRLTRSEAVVSSFGSPQPAGTFDGIATDGRTTLTLPTPHARLRLAVDLPRLSRRLASKPLGHSLNGCSPTAPSGCDRGQRRGAPRGETRGAILGGM